MTTSSPQLPADLTQRLCAFIHDTTLASIPDKIQTRAKYLILDGIACAIVGSHLPWSSTAVGAIAKLETPGAGKCTLIGHDHNDQHSAASPLAATLLNSTFIQGFELDDYHSSAPLHSNALLLPALLATAESQPSTIDSRTFSGADFLRAYIVGLEVGPRVGLALGGADLLSRGWHSGSLQGPSATAAALSAFLELREQQIDWALGTACTQAGGLMSAQFGSMAKRMQHGFAARNGLTAAMLAREGYTGIEGVFERQYGGFLSCFGQGAEKGTVQPEKLVEGLGSVWEVEGVRVKLHAAMAALHCPIDCIAQLQREHAELFAPANLSQIAHIRTEHSKAAYEHGGWIAPPNEPLTSVAAQMSIQYAVAAQLVDRQVLMQQFSDDRLNRPILRDLMAKISPEHNAAFDATTETTWRTKATVRFESGKEVSVTLNAARGIEPAASNEEIVGKWRALVGEILDEGRMEEIERCVLGLEKLEDVVELGRLLSVHVQCPIDA